MDFETLLRFAAALVAVLGLILLLGALARRFGLAGRLPSGASKRLRVVEALALGGRRQLILVRRDGVEHLILTGATSDLVVEANIRSAPEAAP